MAPTQGFIIKKQDRGILPRQNLMGFRVKQTIRHRVHLFVVIMAYICVDHTLNEVSSKDTRTIYQ